MTGERIRHWTIREKLGEGAMGVVYAALDERRGRIYALKFLRPGLSDAAKSRFWAEARAASALRHPHIVRVHELVSEEGGDFIVMERVEGKTLAELMKDGAIDIGETVQIGRQIASAVAAANAAGIVHSDLKPANVMVGGDGGAKLLDFGLSRLIDTTSLHEPQDRVGGGTGPYMSPEQVQRRELDGRSDVFSFGALLYEMACGRRAFDGATSQEAMASVLSDEPMPLRGVQRRIPRELELIAARCLRKDVERRYQSMAEVRIALTELEETMNRRRSRLRLPGAKYWLVASLAAAGAVTVTWRLTSRRPLGPIPEPLTNFKGTEETPAWSPDGKFIAFAWRPEPINGETPNSDIYVMEPGSGHAPRRLTSDPAREISPAWSNDGTRIAFLRRGDSIWNLFVTSAEGGAAKQVLAGVSGVAAWTADDRWLIFPKRNANEKAYRLRAISLVTGEVKTLTTPPEDHFGDRMPAVSPDGKTIAFSRQKALGLASIFTLEIDGQLRPQKALRRVTRNEMAAEPAWLPSGKEIVYSTGETLVRIGTGGNDPARPIPIQEVNSNPAISRAKGVNRLAFTRTHVDRSIWRVVRKQDGTWGDPQRHIDLVREEIDGQYSPDRRKIAFMSNSSGYSEVWIANADGSHPAQLTHARLPAGSVRWSPDGKWLAFDARANGTTQIFVVSAEGGVPRQVTKDASDHAIPFWSRDGRWIYYRGPSPRAAESEKIDIASGRTVTVSKTATHPVESFDGKSIYFINAQYKVVRRSLPSGVERELSFEGKCDGFVSTVEGGAYFTTDRGAIHFFNEQADTLETAGQLPSNYRGAFSIAPDGNSYLYMVLERIDQDLMVIDNYR